jgi:hypothetical protein
MSEPVEVGDSAPVDSPEKAAVKAALSALTASVNAEKGPETADYLVIRRVLDEAIIGLFRLAADPDLPPLAKALISQRLASQLDEVVARLDVAAGLLKYGDQPGSEDQSDPVSQFVTYAHEHRKKWDAIIEKHTPVETVANDSGGVDIEGEATEVSRIVLPTVH